MKLLLDIQAIYQLAGRLFDAAADRQFTLRQAAALVAIADGYGTNQLVLAHAIHSDRTTIGPILKGLAKLGLIVSARATLPGKCNTDRRSKTWRLTPAGKRAVQQCRTMLATVEKELTKQIPSLRQLRVSDAAKEPA